MEVNFSLEEFIILCFVLGADTIVGLEDNANLLQSSPDELREIWLRVASSLQEKRFIGSVAEGAVEIDAGIHTLISACAWPKRVLRTQITNSGSAGLIQTNYYFHEAGIVVITQNAQAEGQLTVRYLDDIEEALQILQGQLEGISAPLEEEASTHPVSVSLDRTQYYDFLSPVYMRNAGKAARVLHGAGLEESFALDAAQGFVGRERFISLSQWLPEGDTAVELSMCYIAEAGCWVIEMPDQADCVIRLTRQSFAAIKQACNHIFGETPMAE
ncbi:hypothetical protein ACFFSY_03520 [Paenibacillus aurantiacus]|uniref:Uncharacterized protein n=1 Tax=Paenibacillus aurantiacus TaxID=1936118 RepID=A0ABV5KIE4_9BACL